MNNPMISADARRRARAVCPWAVALLCVLGCVSTAAAQLPPGFRRVAVVTGLVDVMGVEFAPDGRMFVGERAGRVLLHRDGETQAILQLPVDTTIGEGGLLGMALHPEFDRNSWLYVFRTMQVNGLPHSRISRFTVTGDPSDLASEVVIWELALIQTAGHFSGCIGFGPDGMLYATTGDQWQAEGAQDVTTPFGKMLRMHPDGAVPADNPFVDQPGIAPLVWAYGLRNPFRFSFDRDTGELYVGDVGYDTWEEVSRVERGDNCGWPIMEGPECFSRDCSGFRPPFWYYRHGDPEHGGVAVIMGEVYRGAQFPEEYRGNIFVGDFVGGYIRRLILDDRGNVVDDPLFINVLRVTEIEVGPDGRLYYTSFWDEQDTGVYRIEYEDPNANRPPIAVAIATPNAGVAPLQVQFSSDGSYDPDARPQQLSHRWAFGDGEESTEPNPRHTYHQRGEYRPRLVVSDGKSEAIVELSVRVGEAPFVAISEPPASLLFRAGQTVTVRARGFDVEDGTLPESAYSTRVLLIRTNGAYNVLAGPIAGSSQVEFEVPVFGRPLDDSRIRIEVTVTDSDGSSDFATRDIAPDLMTIVIETEPAGIPVFVNELPRDTPASLLGPISYQYVIEAQESYPVNGEEYRFAEWSDGGPRVRTLSAPEGGARLLARYERADVGPDDGATGNEQPDNKQPDSEQSADADSPGAGCLPCMLGPLAVCAMGLLTRGQHRSLWRRWRTAG